MKRLSGGKLEWFGMAGAMAAAAVLLSSASAAPGLPEIERSTLDPFIKARTDAPHAARRVLVKFRPSASASTSRAALARADAAQAESIGGTGWVTATTSADAQHVAEELRTSPAVAAVALDHQRVALDDPLPRYPNDPLFGQQRPSFDSTALPVAWGAHRGSPALKIAIVDTGVDLDHPDLAAHVLPGRDFVNGDLDASDDEGHGTQVAGLAAAITDNGRGVAGAAWDARILPVKVLDASGGGFDSDIAAGIVWAADLDADVINLSLGGPDPSPVLRDAVAYATARGSIVVAAAGNDGSDTPTYPAAVPEAIAVSATDSGGRFAWFSNHGTWVDVAAPGIELVSTALAPGPVEAYASDSGTSLAAPLVSGTAGLVRAALPTAAPDEIARRVVELAGDFGPGGIDPFYGHGRMNASSSTGLEPRWISEWTDGDENDAASRAVSLDGGQMAVAKIAPEGDADWYSVDLGAPAFVQFFAVPPEFDADVMRAAELDPVLEVFGPDLQLLNETDSTAVGQAETASFDAARAGRYYVRVTNWHGSVSDEYRVGVEIQPARSSHFLPLATYRAGPTVSSTIGDVTIDGRSDLLVTTTGDDGLSPLANSLLVYPQRADGWLVQPIVHGPGDAYTWGEIAVGDMDRDGRADVVAGGVGILYGSDAGLAEPDPVAGLFRVGYQLDVGDVDLDGDLDVVTNAGDTGNRLLLNQGGRRFVQRTISTEAGDHRSLEAGDVTGDGRLDVVTSSGRVVKVFAQLADGSFAPAQQHAPAPAAPGYDHVGGIEVADVTGDGRADVAAVLEESGPNGRLNVFPQRPGGGLGSPIAYPAGSNPHLVEAGDLEGDGRLDLVVSHWGVRALGVYVQKADGALEHTSPADLGYTSRYATSALSVGDISGDGAGDIALAQTDSVGFNVLRQRTARWPRESGWVVSTSPATHARAVATPIVPRVRFARTLDPASVNESTVQLRNAQTLEPVAAAAAYDSDERTISIVPTGSLQPNLHHLLTVAGVRATDGEPMVEPLEVRFLTTPMPPDLSMADRTRYETAQTAFHDPGPDAAASVGSARQPATDDVTPPQTFIVNGPRDHSGWHAIFAFSASEADASFVCRLDDAVLGSQPCGRASAFRELRDGTHVLEVAAVDAAGNQDPSPAVARWRSNRNTWQPDTKLDGGTWGTSTDRSASFRFSASEPGQFECSLDGGEFLACSSPTSYHGLRTGTHSFRVRVTNLYGNVDTTPVLRWWTVEDEPPPPAPGDSPPETRLDEGPPSETGGGWFRFRFSSSEEGSTFECALDGAPYERCTSPVDVPLARDGSHVFQVRARDATGNPDRTPAEATWRIDSTGPETTITSAPPHDTQSRAATFEFRSSESPATFECSLDGASFAPCSSPHTVDGLPDGVHRFSVRALDRFLNQDTSEATAWWVVDNEPPESRIRRAPPATTYETTATIEFDADWPSTIECSLDAGPYAECSSPVTYRGLSQGDHVVRVRVTDRAGNVDPTPAEARWTITEPPPRTPPETTITSGPPSNSNWRDAYIYFKSSESGSRFECSFDGGAFTQCSSPKALTGLGDGPHSLQVRAIDADGDVDSTPDRHDWVVDTVRPETRIDSVPSSPSRSSAATITFSSDEPEATFRCALDGSLTQSCSSPWTIEGLDDGQHTVDVIAGDRAGNHDGDSAATHTWQVDTNSPETTIVEAPPDTTSASVATFRFAADEDASAFECSVDGTSYERCAPTVSLDSLEPRRHSMTVRAVDHAGNADESPDRHSWTVMSETTLIAAGDIADCIGVGEYKTSTIIDDYPDATVAALGDLAYFNGTPQEFQNCYDPSWGRHKARTRPTPGNHEYGTSGAAGYFGYFGASAGPTGKGWYSYDLDGWHVVVLNSNCTAGIDCTVNSEQLQWLRDDLAAHPVDCTMAYWHHPLFTSGTHAGDDDLPLVRTFWNELYARGVDVILNGHDHDYERFAPQTPAGVQDLAYGIREFVVGTGGANLRPQAVPRPATSEAFHSATYGVLKLVLQPGGYAWEFLGEPGTTFTDSGIGSCHGAPDQTPPEGNPSLSSSHTSAWSNDDTVQVSWTGASDSGSGLDGYSYSWTQAAGDSPDEIKDVEETVNSATSDPLTPDGDWWFHLRTKDNAGNWSSAVHLGPVRIDTVAPTNPMVSSSHVQGAWSNDTTADVSWTGASDDRSGVEGYSFFWTQSAADVPDTTKEPAGTTSSATLTDGQWWFHLRTRDSAGNWSGAMHTGPFRIDTSLPANPVPSSTHPSSWSTDNTVDVAWSGAADTGSGVDGFSYSWTQQATSDPGAAKGVEESAGSANSGPLPDGDWWFHLRTRDNAGNWSAAVHLGPFRIDTAPPTNPALSSSHVPNDWSNDSTVEVSWTGASDLLSGVDGYAYSWTQQDTSDPGITKTAEDNVGSATSVPLPDGSWWFHLRTRDNAGNWSAAVHRGPFKIDTTAPTNPTLSSPSHTVGEWSNEATVVLEWDAQAGHAYSYRWSESQSELPDETPEPGHSWVVETLRDGSWWFLLRTRDSAGSWSGTARLGPFLVDTTAPVATITAGPPGATTENTAAFEFVVSESASLSCGLDGATPAACASPVLYGGLATGGHVFRLQASDRAGNQSGPAEWRWTIVAAPPPPPPPPSPPQPPPPPPIDPPPKRPPQVARCVVPRIIGRTVRRARIMISSAGCRVGRVRTAYSPRVRKGLVLTQGPRAGRRLPRGTRVGMVVSLGKKPAPRRR